MPDVISKNAFTIEYDEIRLRAISKITISNEGSSVEDDVKWDTGSSTSCTSTKIAEDLGLLPVRKATVFSADSVTETSAYRVNITLPNGYICNDMLVFGVALKNHNVDALIGMDIITQGDFSVSNYNGKTTFTFRTPSQGIIDFTK